MSAPERWEYRAAISNAFYNARNTGRTMEEAADDAADAVMILVAKAAGSPDHDLRRGPLGWTCACGWEPRLGEVARRAYDRHLIQVTVL